MFRRPRSLFVILAVIFISMAAITVLSQSAFLPSSNVDMTSTKTISAESAASGSRVDPQKTPITPVAPSLTPTVPPAPGISTPDVPGKPVVVPTLPPFTPSVPSAAAERERQVEPPLHLKIPSIGVDTTIEWVGLDKGGNMDVPSTYRTVAWYEHGPNPGMKGNAVVAGHLDSQTGPAVFYRIGDLKPGDEIFVVTHDGEELRFAVTGVESFDADSAPAYNVFGPAPTSNLNLITCEGSFDSVARQYNKRLVVYSTLVTS